MTFSAFPVATSILQRISISWFQSPSAYLTQAPFFLYYMHQNMIIKLMAFFQNMVFLKKKKKKVVKNKTTFYETKFMQVSSQNNHMIQSHG